MYLDFFKLMELSRRLFILGSCLEINNQGYYNIHTSLEGQFNYILNGI